MNTSTKSTATLKWKGEVTFEGTIEQFKSFNSALEKHQVSIAVSDLDHAIGKFHPAGYIRPILSILQKDQIEKLADGAQRFQYRAIEGIAGGIRTPHIHLNEEILLIDKERFKNIVGDVAKQITLDRIDLEDDYCNMVKTIATEQR